MTRCELIEDDGGFSTLGMVIALLLALVLIFSGLRVYQVQTRSAGIQEVADVSALAAEGQVALFVSVARMCDAAVLSFSLAGLVTAGLGIAALCIPATQPYADGLLQVARKTIKLRDEFSRQAAEGLELYQRCLPFLATVKACQVARANGGDGASYVALAVLAPFEGEPIGGFDADSAGAEDMFDRIDEAAEDVKDRAKEAEEIARQGDELKKEAWLLDCGSEDRCLRERAAHLGGLSDALNPDYRSWEAWSFSVPLARCRAYYRARLAAENPAVYAGNPEMQADSVLRQRVYRYAVEEFGKAYVVETDDGLDYYCPVLPRNLAELRQTVLYTERVYPMSVGPNGTVVMHAWSGCPGVTGGVLGSIQQLESSNWATCQHCGFNPYSLADVCAATSVVNSGFEYYYRQIVQLLEQYKKNRDQVADTLRPAKGVIGKALRALGDLLKQFGNARLEVCPPGAYGAIVVVVDVGAEALGGGVSSAFLGGQTVLGTCVAVSAATVIDDGTEGSPTVISGLLGALGLTDSSSGVGVGGKVADVFLRLWSNVIQAYNRGQEQLEQAAQDALDSWSWTSSSGLGSWVAKKYRALMKDVGLQPSPCTYVRPVLVNTGLVAAADDGAFSQGFLAVKTAADQVASAGESIARLTALVGSAGADQAEGVPEGGIAIAIVEELLQEDSPLVIAFTLLAGDEAAADAAAGSAVSWVLAGLLSWAGVREGKAWR